MLNSTIWLIVLCFSLFTPLAYGENSKTPIKVRAADFQFTPNAWSVSSGEKISFVLTNEGVQDHEWVVLKQGTEVTLPFDEDDEVKVFWEIEAQPGETKNDVFVAPAKPGIYTIVCGKPRHIERGMKATLVVK